MAQPPRFGRREVQALQSLLSGRSWSTRIAALIVLAVFAWGWWQHGNGVSGSLSAGMVLQGEVVAVADGDTLTVLDAARRQYRLRLAYIDAPEKSQAFGQIARQALSDRVFRKQVQAQIVDIDRYQRGVAVVSVAGEPVNYAQVAAGLAWHYQRYAQGKQSSEEFARYEAAEQTSRTERRGLWADARPVPPWDYRQASRHGESS